MIFCDFFKNGPTSVSFWLFLLFSNANFTKETGGFSRILTQIVGIEGEHADHLTTTTAQLFSFGCRVSEWLISRAVKVLFQKHYLGSNPTDGKSFKWTIKGLQLSCFYLVKEPNRITTENTCENYPASIL